MDDNGPAGPVRLVAPGVAPEDGLTCYPPLAPPGGPCLYGDYSAARVDEHGDVWIATEYVGPGLRGPFSNFFTFVGRIETDPDDHHHT